MTLTSNQEIREVKGISDLTKQKFSDIEKMNKTPYNI